MGNKQPFELRDNEENVKLTKTRACENTKFQNIYHYLSPCRIFRTPLT